MPHSVAGTGFRPRFCEVANEAEKKSQADLPLFSSTGSCEAGEGKMFGKPLTPEVLHHTSY